jgi:hypothetical protein
MVNGGGWRRHRFVDFGPYEPVYEPSVGTVANEYLVYCSKVHVTYQCERLRLCLPYGFDGLALARCVRTRCG